MIKTFIELIRSAFKPINIAAYLLQNTFNTDREMIEEAYYEEEDDNSKE